jgi:hypothetical protein
MSIATLKRKTQVQYNNMSVGQNGFSLNGTRRSAGYVGQDTLGRSLVRSLSRNGALKGHGGCCGKYPTPEIKMTPEMSGLNNPAIVKSASLTTNGMFMSRHRWIRRPQPYSTTKPNGNVNNNAQSNYIDYLARKTLYDAKKCEEDTVDTKPSSTICKKCPSIFKADKYTGALDANELFRKQTKACEPPKFKDDFNVPTNTKSGIPFACGRSTAV